jgi:hypothetical protein
MLVISLYPFNHRYEFINLRPVPVQDMKYLVDHGNGRNAYKNNPVYICSADSLTPVLSLVGIPEISG